VIGRYAEQTVFNFELSWPYPGPALLYGMYAWEMSADDLTIILTPNRMNLESNLLRW
jgi:hypothetical protein